MKRSTCLLVGVLSILAFISYSGAAVINVSSLDGSSPGIGYDPDKPAPTVSSEGFHASGGVGNYNSVRFTPSSIGMTGLTLGEITAASYEAKNATAGTLDWRLKVYTVDQDGIGGAWYGVRVEAPTTASGTDYTLHPLTSYDRITAGDNSFNLYAPDPALYVQKDLAAGQQVLFFDISAGAKTGGYAYDTTLQNISISRSDGTTSIISAVPEPSSIAAMILCGIGLLRRHRR
jgi:hypothetical protein